MSPSANALEQELIDVERQFWNALQEKDAAAASKLTDDSASSSAHKASRRSTRRRWQR